MDEEMKIDWMSQSVDHAIAWMTQTYNAPNQRDVVQRMEQNGVTPRALHDMRLETLGKLLDNVFLVDHIHAMIHADDAPDPMSEDDETEVTLHLYEGCNRTLHIEDFVEFGFDAISRICKENGRAEPDSVKFHICESSSSFDVNPRNYRDVVDEVVSYIKQGRIDRAVPKYFGRQLFGFINSATRELYDRSLDELRTPSLRLQEDRKNFTLIEKEVGEILDFMGMSLREFHSPESGKLMKRIMHCLKAKESDAQTRWNAVLNIVPDLVRLLGDTEEKSRDDVQSMKSTQRSVVSDAEHRRKKRKFRKEVKHLAARMLVPNPQLGEDVAMETQRQAEHEKRGGKAALVDSSKTLDKWMSKPDLTWKRGEQVMFQVEIVTDSVAANIPRHEVQGRRYSINLLKKPERPFGFVVLIRGEHSFKLLLSFRQGQIITWESGWIAYYSETNPLPYLLACLFLAKPKEFGVFPQYQLESCVAIGGQSIVFTRRKEQNSNEYAVIKFCRTLEVYRHLVNTYDQLRDHFGDDHRIAFPTHCNLEALAIEFEFYSQNLVFATEDEWVDLGFFLWKVHNDLQILHMDISPTNILRRDDGGLLLNDWASAVTHDDDLSSVYSTSPFFSREWQSEGNSVSFAIKTSWDLTMFLRTIQWVRSSMSQRRRLSALGDFHADTNLVDTYQQTGDTPALVEFTFGDFAERIRMVVQRFNCDDDDDGLNDDEDDDFQCINLSHLPK